MKLSTFINGKLIREEEEGGKTLEEIRRENSIKHVDPQPEVTSDFITRTSPQKERNIYPTDFVSRCAEIGRRMANEGKPSTFMFDENGKTARKAMITRMAKEGFEMGEKLF